MEYDKKTRKQRMTKKCDKKCEEPNFLVILLGMAVAVTALVLITDYLSKVLN